MATKEEWKKGFCQLNDREPSVEEFLEAQANGEIESEEIEQNIKHEQSVSSKPQNNANRQVFKKNKRYFIIGGGIIAIIIVVIGIFSFMSSRPKDIINEVKIEFSGYNKAGSATLSGNYKYVMESIIAKKVGYSNSDVEAIKKGHDQVLTTNNTKFTQVEKYVNDTSIRLNKATDLSNGDKIILSVETSLKDSPIKSSKKTIKVSGLNKSATYTMSDIIKKYPIKVTGYNHFGKLEFNNDIYTLPESSISSDNETKLANGDVVKIKLSDDYFTYLSEHGQIAQGDNETAIKVSGLSDSPKMTNLSDLLNQTDMVARNGKKSNDFDTYTITRQDSYFIGTNIYSSKSGGFSVIAIYKADDYNSSDKETTTKYWLCGYEGLTVTGDKVNIPSLDSGEVYADYAIGYSSSQEALDSLKSDYPSLVKIN